MNAAHSQQTLDRPSQQLRVCLFLPEFATIVSIKNAFVAFSQGLTQLRDVQAVMLGCEIGHLKHIGQAKDAVSCRALPILGFALGQQRNR